jgi:two-component system cell cycle response regulator
MPRKILTVDDSKTIRMIIGRTFSKYDCAIVEAANGEEGLARAAAEKPDLIVLDITMPVMDGVTMLGKLRQDPAFKATPVIMLTAESGRENVVNITQLGISDYLVKPFKDEQLLEKVVKILPLQLKAA